MESTAEADRQLRTHLLWESVGTEIPKSKFESSVRAVDDDFDGDQRIRTNRSGVMMSCRHDGDKEPGVGGVEQAGLPICGQVVKSWINSIRELKIGTA
jgi:hypothetical protein